jgi:hypothetical protein
MSIKKLLNNYTKNSVKKDGRWYEITLKPTLDQIIANPFILNRYEVEAKILSIDGLTIPTYMTDDYRDDRQHACLSINYELPAIFENLSSYEWLKSNQALFNTNELVTFYCKVWNAIREEKNKLILENWNLLTENNLNL